jgi:hypothetical protein
MDILTNWNLISNLLSSFQFLPVVLYGCETWSLTLRDKHGLRVFESRVLRMIYGSRRDEVTGKWRRVHNEELYAVFSSPELFGCSNQESEMGRACSTYRGEERCRHGFGWEICGKETTWKTKTWLLFKMRTGPAHCMF